MKSVLLGCVVATLLAFGAYLVLAPAQTPASEAYSTEGVRLSPAGH